MQIFKTRIPVKTIISAVVGLILLMGSIYTVNEGHIGIVKRFSEAKEQVNPAFILKCRLLIA